MLRRDIRMTVTTIPEGAPVQPRDGPARNAPGLLQAVGRRSRPPAGRGRRGAPRRRGRGPVHVVPRRPPGVAGSRPGQVPRHAESEDRRSASPATTIPPSTAPARATRLPATFGAANGNEGGFTSVGEAGCAACHVSHGAAPGARLVRKPPQDDDAPCLRCHASTVTRHDIGREVAKAFGHDGKRSGGVHDMAEGRPGGRPLPEASPGAARHATCVDCHDPHTATSRPAVAPAPRGAHGRLGHRPARGAGRAGPLRVRGLLQVPRRQREPGSGGGRARRRHGAEGVERDQPASGLLRPAPSSHPVAAPPEPDVPGLRAPYAAGSIIYCSDCHASDDRRRGPAGPGPGARTAPPRAPPRARLQHGRPHRGEPVRVRALLQVPRLRRPVLGGARRPASRTRRAPAPSTGCTSWREARPARRATTPTGSPSRRAVRPERPPRRLRPLDRPPGPGIPTALRVARRGRRQLQPHLPRPPAHRKHPLVPERLRPPVEEVSMRSSLRVPLLTLAVAASGVLGGCATTGKPAANVVWPPPPETPRVRFIRAFSTEEDLGSGFMRSLGRACLPTEESVGIAQPTGLALLAGREDALRHVQRGAAHHRGGPRAEHDAAHLRERRAPRRQPVRRRDGRRREPLRHGSRREPRLRVRARRDVPAQVREGQARAPHRDRDRSPPAPRLRDRGVGERVEAPPDRGVLAEGDHLRTIGTRGHQPGEFNFPRTPPCPATATSTSSTCSTSGCRSSITTASSSRCSAPSVGAPGTFDKAKSIAFDAFGNVYVVDSQRASSSSSTRGTRP